MTAGSAGERSGKWHGTARPAAVTEAKLRPRVFHQREGNQGHGVYHYLRALSAMVVAQYGSRCFGIAVLRYGSRIRVSPLLATQREESGSSTPSSRDTGCNAYAAPIRSAGRLRFE